MKGLFVLVIFLSLSLTHAIRDQDEFFDEDEDIYNDFDPFDDLDQDDPLMDGNGLEDDEFFFDEDEFEGIPPPPPPPSSKKPSQPKYRAVPESPPNWILEILASIFIVIYTVNFFVGRAKNDAIAAAWYKQFEPIFSTQFSSLGAYLRPEDDNPVMKDSQSCFKFYASGRRYCTGMLCTLELRKRHDLFSLALALFGQESNEDTLVIEVPVASDEMEPIIFAIVKSDQARKLKETTRDFNTYTSHVQCDMLPENFSILTDSRELVVELIDQRVADAFEEYGDLIEMIHFTDQNKSTFTSTNNVLRFTYKLPSDVKDMDRLTTLIKMSIFFIDRIASLALTPHARTRAENKRNQVARDAHKRLHAQRQEALSKRKQEVRRQEKQSAAASVAASMSKEAKRRKEARERKKKSKTRVKVR